MMAAEVCRMTALGPHRWSSPEDGLAIRGGPYINVIPHSCPLFLAFLMRIDSI